MSDLFKPWQPERRCLACGKVITGRSDKKYCNNGCKDAFHNAENKRKNATTYSYEKLLRQNEKQLEMLSGNSYYHKWGIEEGPLKGQGVDLSVCINVEQHLKTGGVIYWYGCYGVELPTTKGGPYMLHQRSKEKVLQYKITGGKHA